MCPYENKNGATPASYFRQTTPAALLCTRHMTHSPPIVPSQFGSLIKLLHCIRTTACCYPASPASTCRLRLWICVNLSAGSDEGGAWTPNSSNECVICCFNKQFKASCLTEMTRFFDSAERLDVCEQNAEERQTIKTQQRKLTTITPP